MLEDTERCHCKLRLLISSRQARARPSACATNFPTFNKAYVHVLLGQRGQGEIQFPVGAGYSTLAAFARHAFCDCYFCLLLMCLLGIRPLSQSTATRFAMQVHVYLPSGKSCSVSLPSPESSVHELKAAAQQEFKRRFLRLAFKAQQLELSSSLSEAGVENGDHIDAFVQPVKLASTNHDFALHFAGGAVVAWGQTAWAFSISPVREQLVRVQQIQATWHAFAAILDDGSVVTWGIPAGGADSSQVQEQLVQVQKIQATSCAFAAILADGSVVTWGNPYSGGDSSQVQVQLVRVQQIQATLSAVAAILDDGSVVAWGNPDYGGDCSQVKTYFDVL